MQGMDAFAPLPRVKSNSEPYAIPSTSKLSSTSHNDSYPNRESHLPPYSLPPPPILAPLTPAPPVTQAIAPVAQASMASVTIPTPAPVANPVAPTTALVIVVGGPPDPLPPPPPGSEPGSMQLISTICQLADLPPPQHPQDGGTHLIHRSQLVGSTFQT